MIMFFQETHFGSDAIPKCKNKYTTRFHSTNPYAKSKAVSIAMHKNVKCQILDSKSDSQGRYLFLKTKNGIKIYTIANVYFPNTSQTSEGLKYIHILESFPEGDIILRVILIWFSIPEWIHLRERPIFHTRLFVN